MAKVTQLISNNQKLNLGLWDSRTDALLQDWPGGGSTALLERIILCFPEHGGKEKNSHRGP